MSADRCNEATDNQAGQDSKSKHTQNAYNSSQNLSSSDQEQHTSWEDRAIFEEGYFNIDDIPFSPESAGERLQLNDDPSSATGEFDTSADGEESRSTFVPRPTFSDEFVPEAELKASAAAQEKLFQHTTKTTNTKSQDAVTMTGTTTNPSTPNLEQLLPSTNTQSQHKSLRLQMPRYVVGQPVEIRIRDQWSSARVLERRGDNRVMVELSTAQRLEVLDDNIRPLTHILHGTAADILGSIKSGYLSKAPVSASSSKSQGYVARFFILNAGHLLYFRDETSKYPKGKIVLKHNDILKKVNDLRLSLKLVDGYALKSTNLILTNLTIQNEGQRKQNSKSSGDRMVRTNGRNIMLKAESKEVCKEWFDALSTTLENLKFAATLTSDQLQRYQWHPWISRDGNVMLRHIEYDPDEHLNDIGWCMPLPIAVTSLINIETQSGKSNAKHNDFMGTVWDDGTLEGIAAWVVSLTPDNSNWRRKKNRPALSTVKPMLIKLLGRALILLVRIGDADTAAIFAEKAVLLSYAHVALATLSFSLSILSDAIQRMHCPPVDILQSRKFSDAEDNARRAIEYVRAETPSKNKPSPVEPIPSELLYYISLKAYNSLENVQKQRGESFKKTEKDAKIMKKNANKSLGDAIRAIPPLLTFPAVVTPAPWIIRLCDEQKYLLSKNMIGHHNVLDRTMDERINSSEADEDYSRSGTHAPSTENDSPVESSFSKASQYLGERKPQSNEHRERTPSIAASIAKLITEGTEKRTSSSSNRQCFNISLLTAPRNYYHKFETLARITNAFVRRPGYGNAFERCNINVVEEALSYAAKPISTIEQSNLDLLWNVNFLRRLHQEGRKERKKHGQNREESQRVTRDDNNHAAAASKLCSAKNSARINMHIEKKLNQRFSNRFEPTSLDDDIDKGYFFRRHWWGDERWRRLIQLMAQQQVQKA